MQLIVDDFRKVKLPYPNMTEVEFFDFCAANPDTPQWSAIDTSAFY